MTVRLSQLIERLTGGDGAHTTGYPGLSLYRWSQPTHPCPGLAEPSLCVIAQGQKQVALGDQRLDYDPSQFLLISADVPVASHVTVASPEAPYLALSLRLDHATVCELAPQTIAGQRTPPLQPGPAVAVGPAEPVLYDALTRLVALQESPRDMAVLAPLVMREITYRLLTGPQGARLRQMFVGDGSGQRILRILQWLRAHYAEPVRIEDLAREAHLSPSALHQHFKSVTAMSPLQYQKHLRLHEARRLMLSDGLEAAEASFRVGYESPSQFSREYRRLFGAPPRRDVSLVRGNMPPSASSNAEL